MSKPQILFVDDDVDIIMALEMYFRRDFDIHVAMCGSDVLEKTKNISPDLIVLDIMLPDIDGFEVCRTLQSNLRTRHIPVFFLTQKDDQSDILQGLELGAADYITKPFEARQLQMRMQNAITRSRRDSLTDHRTKLPAAYLIQEQLRRIMREKGWALLYIQIHQFSLFRHAYGFVAGDDILRFTAMMIGEAVNKHGTTSDFIGHATDDGFIVITTETKAANIKLDLKERFEQEVQTYYTFIDRQEGFVPSPAANDRPVQNIPFMTISVGTVLSNGNVFNDIYEIVRQAANASIKG